MSQLTLRSVVQRQMWLMREMQLSRENAYNQARQEFYDARLKEDVERRVAKEEAMASGAYFGKSTLQIGMELEDIEFERWKAWASKEYEALEQQGQASLNAGIGFSEEHSSGDLDTGGALEEISSQAPNQEAFGGAIVHP